MSTAANCGDQGQENLGCTALARCLRSAYAGKRRVLAPPEVAVKGTQTFVSTGFRPVRNAIQRVQYGHAQAFENLQELRVTVPQQVSNLRASNPHPDPNSHMHLYLQRTVELLNCTRRFGMRTGSQAPCTGQLTLLGFGSVRAKKAATFFSCSTAVQDTHPNAVDDSHFLHLRRGWDCKHDVVMLLTYHFD